MAILIGVIALAVIPNIQRSRESKDLSTLDGVMSSLNIAVANTQKKADLDTWCDGNEKTLSALCAANDSFANKFKESFGSDVPSLGSSAAGTAAIKFSVTISGTPKIEVYADGKPDLNYTTNESGGKQKLVVSNGATSN